MFLFLGINFVKPDHNQNEFLYCSLSKHNLFIYVICRWQRSYNKKTSRWSVHPVKVEKNYSYVQDLIRHIITSRIEDDIGMNRPMELEADDPRRISAHLAPVPPPSTRDIVATQISRFENLNKTIEYWTAEGQ